MQNSFASNVSEIVKAHTPNSLDRYYIQPLADIHLHSHLKWELSPNGDIAYIRILVLIGTFILIIACINYVNLITAKSSERAREVGIRKAIGAVRFQLIRQFLTESFLTVLSFIDLCTLHYLAHPPIVDTTCRSRPVVAAADQSRGEMESSFHVGHRAAGRLLSRYLPVGISTV